MLFLTFHKQHCRHSYDVKMTQAVNHTKTKYSQYEGVNGSLQDT